MNNWIEEYEILYEDGLEKYPQIMYGVLLISKYVQTCRPPEPLRL
jgi:hypothetical protein